MGFKKTRAIKWFTEYLDSIRGKIPLMEKYCENIIKAIEDDMCMNDEKLIDHLYSYTFTCFTGNVKFMECLYSPYHLVRNILNYNN